MDFSWDIWKLLRTTKGGGYQYKPHTGYHCSHQWPALQRSLAALVNEDLSSTQDSCWGIPTACTVEDSVMFVGVDPSRLLCRRSQQLLLPRYSRATAAAGLLEKETLLYSFQKMCTPQTPEPWLLDMHSLHRHQIICFSHSVSTHTPLPAQGLTQACPHLRHHCHCEGTPSQTQSQETSPRRWHMLWEKEIRRSPAALAIEDPNSPLCCSRHLHPWPLPSLLTLTSADKAEHALCQWACPGARTNAPHLPGTLAPTCRWRSFPTKTSL